MPAGLQPTTADPTPTPRKPGRAKPTSSRKSADKPLAATSGKAVTETTRPKLRVVTVDDDKSVQEAASEVFAREPEVEWRHFFTKESATAYFHRHLADKAGSNTRRPHVVVLDVQLEAGDDAGLQLVRVINGLIKEKHPYAPLVVMLSVCPDDRIVCESLKGGAHMYLQKRASLASVKKLMQTILQIGWDCLSCDAGKAKRLIDY